VTQLTFARQSAGSDAHLEHSGERLLNCYARPFPDSGVGPFIIAFSRGLAPHVTLSAGNPVRAVYSQRGVVYAACGGKLWSVSGSTVTELGTIPDGPTTIAGNGLQVAIAAGGSYLVWNGAALSTVTPGAFSLATNVASIDNYILIFEQNGERWSVSALADASSVDALDFASAEGAPDFIVRGHVDHSEVWIFGTRSTEIWSNTGNPDFPFNRIAGGKLNRGCAFAGSVASEDNSVFWVGDDRVVYRANGYQPSRVSTQWVESILQDATDVHAFTFTQDGAKVYAMVLPDRPALMFDIASGMWHERNTGLDEGRWIATAACRCGVETFIGTTTGKLCRLSGVTDDGQTIMREGVSLPVSQRRERVTINMAQLNFRTGATDIARDASVMMQVSKDGRIWGPERWKSLGSVGQYDRLVRWFGWGQARQFRWRWRITDPIDGALYGASIE
jgi:hypothetical protein